MKNVTRRSISIFFTVIMMLSIIIFNSMTNVFKASAVSKYSLFWPVPTSVASIGKHSSSFGLRTSPTQGASSNHRGIDIPVPSGTSVFSAADGVVVVASSSNLRGNYVVIYHESIELSTLYQHLTKSLVKKGDIVKGGTEVAISGKTGVGTGPHLHFGVMVGKATKADNDQPRYNMAINPLGSNITYTDSNDRESFDIISFSGRMKVMCNSKGVRSAPYGSSTTTRNVYKNDIIDVVGYVYNEYGNLWYKTDDGDYIHPTYLKVEDSECIPPTDYKTATFKVVASSKTIRTDPYASSELVRTVKNGTYVYVVGYVYNEYGNLWYETDDGYIYCNWLSVQESDSRMPSNYVFSEMEVMSSSKSVRSDPYSSSESMDTVKKGDKINTVGYIYNKYGNLWYMTEEENYIYSNYLKQVEYNENVPSDYKYQIFSATNEKSKNSEPYAAAYETEDIKKGETICTIGYIINLYGNKWYECEDWGYIYNSSIECIHKWNSGIITKVATCVKEGEKTYTCTYCNEIKTESIPCIDHRFQWHYDNNATAKSDGSETQICSVCHLIGETKIVKDTKYVRNCVCNDNGTIYGLTVGLTRNDFENKYINKRYEIDIEYSSDLIATGTTIIFKNNETEKMESYEFVVFGDVDCNGVYDGQDAVLVNMIVNGMLTREQVGESVWMAADCNHDGIINHADVDLLNQAGVLISSVDQTKSTEELLETSLKYNEHINRVEKNIYIEEGLSKQEISESPKLNLLDFLQTIIWAYIKFIISIVVG